MTGGNGGPNGHSNGGNGRNGLKSLLDMLSKIVLAVVSALLIFAFGRFSTLQDNERDTAVGLSYQQGVDIGRAQGVQEERARWQQWLQTPGYRRPEAPPYRDPLPGEAPPKDPSTP